MEAQGLCSLLSHYGMFLILTLGEWETYTYDAEGMLTVIGVLSFWP
jgi:hypothetical protein